MLEQLVGWPTQKIEAMSHFAKFGAYSFTKDAVNPNSSAGLLGEQCQSTHS